MSWSPTGHPFLKPRLEDLRTSRLSPGTSDGWWLESLKLGPSPPSSAWLPCLCWSSIAGQPRPKSLPVSAGELPWALLHWDNKGSSVYPPFMTRQMTPAPHGDPASLPFSRGVRCVRGLQTSLNCPCGFVTPAASEKPDLQDVHWEGKAVLSPEIKQEAVEC